MNTPKQILVFGASGDTGKYFISYFLEHNSDPLYELIAIGSRKTDYFDSLGIKYYSIDISDKNNFTQLNDIPNPYAVIDLAGIMPARMKGYDPSRYIDVNITGTLNILNYCIEKHIDRILFSQSFGDIKEYSEKNPVLHADLPSSFSLNNDHSIYVMSKNFAVDMIKHYNLKYALKAFIFRLPTIYLWSDIDTFYVDGVIRKIGYRSIIDRATAGEDIEVWGNPSRKKDMIYVKDFCQMLYLALFVNKSFGHYNVGTGIGITLEDQIKGIIDVFCPEGKKSKMILRPDLPNAPQYIMDITPAVNDLGYSPKYDYISMLRDFKHHMDTGSF